MSSPDSEILSKIITDETGATYLTHVDSYHKKYSEYASNLKTIAAVSTLNKKLPHDLILKIITQLTQKPI